MLRTMAVARWSPERWQPPNPPPLWWSTASGQDTAQDSRISPRIRDDSGGPGGAVGEEVGGALILLADEGGVAVAGEALRCRPPSMTTASALALPLTSLPPWGGENAAESRSDVPTENAMAARDIGVVK